MSDSPFLRVTASILATIQQNAEFVRTHVHFPVHDPSTSEHLFDPRTTPPTHRSDTSAISTYVASLGLPDALASEVTAILSEYSGQAQSSVDQTQHRLLHDLSTITISPNPVLLPSLVGAACGAFYNATINSGLNAVKEQISTFEVGDESQSDLEAESDSGSETDGSDDDEATEPNDEGDLEDENAPIKPGEEVPPLETRYLPIFEALHERGKVLTKPEKTYLVNMTGMTYRQITIWFQNRRRGELKETSNALAQSHASSIHSDESSDDSDNELKLEERLGNLRQSDTTFSIRSWQLASAAAGTQDANAVHLPPSPIKFGFPAVSDPASDDSDLSDTDDETDVPPGLNMPSLTTSISTLDSTSDRGPPTITSNQSLPPASGSLAGLTLESKAVHTAAFLRPIKPLPASRQQAQRIQASIASVPVAMPPNPVQAHILPNLETTQSVTSNECGLTVEVHSAMPTSMTTLRASPTTTTATSAAFSGTPPSSSPQLATGSPRSSSSPTPSRHSTISPRPAIKPLPRRTGCAPRPRPPPRAAPASTSTSNPTSRLSSARPSVVLPPASNPSLASTTLGALLRPNPPAPAIPPEMEERLSAMTGRMGVGSSPGSVGHSSPLGTGSNRGSITSGVPRFPQRGASFAFGSGHPTAPAGRGTGFLPMSQPGRTEGQSTATESL